MSLDDDGVGFSVSFDLPGNTSAATFEAKLVVSAVHGVDCVHNVHLMSFPNTVFHTTVTPHVCECFFSDAYLCEFQLL